MKSGLAPYSPDWRNARGLSHLQGQINPALESSGFRQVPRRDGPLVRHAEPH